MPWGVVAAGVGGGLALYGSSKTNKAVDKAADREEAAAGESLARQEEAYGEAKTALTPYARQEQAASTQMMAQMGLAPPSGGGGTYMGGGGGDAWGFGAAGPGGTEADQNFDKVLREMMAQAQVRYKKSGYSGSSIHREASGVVQRQLEQLKNQGKLPPGYQMPTRQDLTAMAGEIEDYYGGHTKMAKNLYPEIKGGKDFDFGTYANDQFDQLSGRYGYAPPGDMQPGGPGGMPGGAQMIDPITGEVTGGGGPQAKTAADIMGLAGVEGLPPELRDKYMADLMEDPRTDPELAAYLGLTEESMQVGDAYQQTPAYMKAREAGIGAVDAAAAGGGSLYSGRRGEALRDVGQEVEQGYYMDAMNRREKMMGARRGERTGGITRRGIEHGAGRDREQSYYNNYMQMLQGMSQPTTTTNIASMGTSLGKDSAATLMDTARGVSDLKIGGAGATQAALADVGSGLMKYGASYIGPRGGEE